MKSMTPDHPQKGLRTGISVFTGILLIGATLWGAGESRKRTDTRIRQELARHAVSIAASLPVQDVQALSFTPEDKHRPEYQSLSRSLHAYAKISGLRSIYTLSLLDENTLAFGPESLKPDDIYASAPGEIYQQPLPENFEIFETASPFVTGPYIDEYGSFISAYAPVVHPRSGQVLAVIGVDIEQSSWHLALRRAQWLPVLLITLPLGLLAFIMIQGFLSPPLPSGDAKFPQQFVPALCGLMMLLLTAGTTWLFYQMERIAREETFHTTALLKAEIYANKLKALQNDITALTAFFDSSDLIDHAEFNRFCSQTLADHPIVSVAWCPKVQSSNLEAFERSMRNEGFPDFSVRPLPDAQGLSEFSFPARYVFGISGEHPAPGYDSYATALRREAIDTALRSGRAAASAPLTLVHQPQQPKGFLIFQPATTLKEQGILSIIIQPSDMMRRFGRLSASISSGLSGYLFEITPEEPPLLLAGPDHSSVSSSSELLNPEQLRRTVPLPAFGRTYMLSFQPNAQWYQTHTLQNWKMALFAGLSLTAFLTGQLITLANRPALLEKHVRARTAELGSSEQRFRDLINTIPDLVWLKDPEGHFLNCNRRFEKFFNASEKDIIGKTDYAFVEEEVAKNFRAHDLKAMESHQPVKYEEWVQFASDGHRELLETVKTPLYDEENQLIGTLGISRDITERKVTEEALQKSEEKLRRIIENSTNMFYSHNLEGLLTYVSPQVNNILGYETDGALQNWRTLTSDHPANKQAYQSTDKAIRTGKAQPPYEVQLIHKNGHHVWAEVREAPVVKNGQTVSIVGSLTDITVRKQALEEKEQSQHLLRSILDTIPIRVWWKDCENRFMGINRGCALELGLQNPEELIGKTDHDLFPKEDADHYVADDEEVRNTGRPKLGIEEIIILSNNEQRWQETHKVPLRDSRGNIIGTVGTGIDITAHKHAETELKRSRRLLEQVINANPDLL
ncbi:PAS domain S-box protein [Kiritimatiellaeota bacterium B1221]|nr:PAS domain S-box protein [Kiritimatiellaeota bacterium B1221]